MEAVPIRMAAVSARQHGLVTLDQLTEQDVTSHQRHHLLATGVIARVARFRADSEL